ncbi:MAG: hypothetical protein NT068_02800 [Candidatus Nomurabacteria bacterium]|nr:hypothetical protein [Candidatus Nomurabacteria bacterium]
MLRKKCILKIGEEMSKKRLFTTFRIEKQFLNSEVSEEKWNEINNYYKAGILVEGIVISKKRKGFMVYVCRDVKAYLPFYSTGKKNFKQHISQKFEFKIVNIFENKNKEKGILLSLRDI